MIAIYIFLTVILIGIFGLLEYSILNNNLVNNIHLKLVNYTNLKNDSANDVNTLQQNYEPLFNVTIYESTIENDKPEGNTYTKNNNTIKTNDINSIIKQKELLSKGENLHIHKNNFHSVNKIDINGNSSDHQYIKYLTEKTDTLSNAIKTQIGTETYKLYPRIYALYKIAELSYQIVHNSMYHNSEKSHTNLVILSFNDIDDKTRFDNFFSNNVFSFERTFDTNTNSISTIDNYIHSSYIDNELNSSIEKFKKEIMTFSHTGTIRYVWYSCFRNHITSLENDSISLSYNVNLNNEGYNYGMPDWIVIETNYSNVLLNFVKSDDKAVVHNTNKNTLNDLSICTNILVIFRPDMIIFKDNKKVTDNIMISNQ
uniref:Uncharacterized protein n=1 Tax=Megaviridae environmental sample TaxID=1737588 RepID=A0A5J6VKH3_9VIRU|nr:MAG: hypothetical protein [Megaviridae environmental sample]